MGGAQQLLDAPETFVQEMFASLQQATDYLGVVPASAMNRFTQHLRDAILEQNQTSQTWNHPNMKMSEPS
ncbi:MAG: hypothetical protein ACLVJH_02405 [Faecalibacterium prausnitzii]